MPLILKPHNKIFAADEEVRDIRVAFDKIKESICVEQQKYKTAADKHRKSLEFHEDDWVLLRFSKARLKQKIGKKRGAYWSSKVLYETRQEVLWTLSNSFQN